MRMMVRPFPTHPDHSLELHRTGDVLACSRPICRQNRKVGPRNAMGSLFAAAPVDRDVLAQTGR